jgi:hypothetical protein
MTIPWKTIEKLTLVMRGLEVGRNKWLCFGRYYTANLRREMVPRNLFIIIIIIVIIIINQLTPWS